MIVAAERSDLLHAGTELPTYQKRLHRRLATDAMVVFLSSTVPPYLTRRRNADGSAVPEVDVDDIGRRPTCDCRRPATLQTLPAVKMQTS
jgi:hypothetical protein